MNKKPLIVIVTVTVLLLIFIAVIIRVLTVSHSTDVPNDTDFIAEITENGVVSGQILSWLDTSMRDERGAYNTFYNCTFGEEPEPVCNNGGSSNRTGMAVMWANYVYGQASGYNAAMDRLAQDIAVYGNRELVNIIQTDDLSCFYLEPIVHSEHPAIDREVARKICLDTEYEISLQGDNRYNFTIDALYAHRDNADKLIASIIGETPLAEVQNADPSATSSAEYSLIVDRFWATWTTDHAAKYLINNEPDTLIDAYFFYAGALTEYNKNKASQTDINRSCELLLASSQMCRLVENKDNTSCQFTAWLDKKLEEMPIADNTQGVELEAIAKCALANTENRDRYISFITNYYNSPENNYYQFEETKLLNEYGGLSKNVVSNALYAGLSAGN